LQLMELSQSCGVHLAMQQMKEGCLARELV
jgi:hypothetical protein